MTKAPKVALEAGAEPHDVAIQYMQRTRDYYLRLGYDNPYRWSHYRDVPFAPLAKPIGKCRVTMVVTAAPYQPEKGDQGPGAAYNSAAKFYKIYAGDTLQTHDLRISHISYDRKHTSAVDQGCWNPLEQLRIAAKQGLIGSLGPHFYGVPTNRSQATTIETDAPEIVRRCLDDGIDAVLLVPNCPVCHQSVSITARHLEAAGIATVVMGCAKDIVEHAGVPRLLFSDFPLGNGAGRPNDVASQRDTLAAALRLLGSAPGPRTTMQNPLRWSESADWKQDYLNLDRMSPEEVARRRADVDRQKEVARQVRESAGLVKKAGRRR
jgi:hypothetical protein